MARFGQLIASLILILMQLDLFFYHKRKWEEVSYIQDFMALKDDPKLCTNTERSDQITGEK